MATPFHDNSALVEEELPRKQLRVAAVQGMLQSNTQHTSTIDMSRLQSFNEAVETAIADVNTLRERSLTLLYERFSSLDKTAIIHKEDFQGDGDQICKKLLYRMKEFNKNYKDKNLDKHLRLGLSKVKSPTITIGVLGRIKCGKSTLLNALTYSEFFPTDQCNPETSVIVSIRHSSSMHSGLCDTDPQHGKGLNCPQLQNELGVVIATRSFDIQEKLAEINTKARHTKAAQQYYTIVTNIPALSNEKSAINLVLQDTPGLGEAVGSKATNNIADLAETALLNCSAYIYILDCNKLRDLLDVEALELLQNKDTEVYKDGRLITVANLLDRAIERAPGSRSGRKITSLTQIQNNVRHMMKNDIKIVIPESLVIPAVALWASCSRLIPLDDLDGMEDLHSWRKKFERTLDIRRDRKVNSKDFIEKASGIQTIEEWLRMVAQFSEPVLQKSKYSDALHCSKVCINTSDLYQQELKRKADELVCEMEVQQAMWNEAVKLFNDIETQLLLFRSILEAAYDQDTKEPKQRMLGIANELLDTFQSTCLQKCSAPQYGEKEEGSEPLLVGDESEERARESEREVEGGEVEDGEDDDDTTLDDTHKDLPNTVMSKVYRVLEFKLNLQSFIVELESRINDYLETVRFVCVPAAIPLEEFGENKKQLYQYALNFFNTKMLHRQQNEAHVYKAPRPDEIQDILTHHEVTLNQLREKAEIKKLKLGWLGRMVVWIKAKFGQEDAKETHTMRRGDVVSAIQYLRNKKCIDECIRYLEVTLKKEIVECYYNTYSQHVKAVLQEYEENCLTLMAELSSKKETEIQEVLRKLQQTCKELNYLINCNYTMQQLKNEVNLELVKAFGKEEETELDASDLNLSQYSV
ncbi:PREDICTED: uncharacterized protein LOC109585416 isoform X2 [Amphimedon queenslandica]|uniref:Dynamin N-terminal domain-containing protein n=1 Tax=Amphimedon queenslandica TaxID=400682 RepID=A0A1X7VNZ6_AMPQE|nr:PREDICTED: uncharacterized protein LOC109585416 isoform X2 [Amphimedon queenslandica]|eukprot:XP_019857060.1 PREDICTED: uncharacterized protein LOC109585416 isoform X2 [Amphimedon queenslandica]